MTGVIFNIQNYSLHDGPGIRTAVFLKGCPLRCVWCANPESQNPKPEIYFDGDKCIKDKGCNFCEGICQSQAIKNKTLDFERCTNCLKCANICPSQALQAYGKEMTVEETISAVEKEQAFYRRGKGGITLSGGEPFFQGDFAIALLKEAKRRHIHTAVETCGFCGEDILREAANFLDYIMFDIKILDEEKHWQYTGVSNRPILRNLEMLNREFPHIKKKIRTPIIPSVNYTKEDILAIKNFLSTMKNYTYELLKYHRFGEKKYAMLGREYPNLPSKLSEETWKELNDL